MQCTIPRLIDAQPNRPRSFRIFRDIRAATKFAVKCEKMERCPTVRVTQYGMFAVNFYGSNPKPRVKLAKARLVMWHGFSFDRQLPVPLA